MIVIGKDKFEVKRPTAMRSFALQQRIIPVAGNVIGAVASAVGIAGGVDVKRLMESDITKVLEGMPSIGLVFSRMPPGELEFLTRVLLGDPKEGGESSTMNSAPLFAVGGDAFDLMMQGRHLDVWRLLLHALEVWYPDFFALVQPFIATAKKEPISAESSTSPQPGPASA